ncbi:MAG: hypothetical protein NVS3B20_04650 [Polyangiales bacterium]
MADEAFVQKIKSILAMARTGTLDTAYGGYRDFFSDPSFLKQKAEDQRQALKLMVLAKGAPKPPTEAMLEAHRAAVGPLTELVSGNAEPGDYEMLGVCHLLLGNMAAGERILREGLTLERAKDPSSSLCGRFMNRISAL